MEAPEGLETYADYSSHNPEQLDESLIETVMSGLPGEVRIFNSKFFNIGFMRFFMNSLVVCLTCLCPSPPFLYSITCVLLKWF